MVLTGLLDASLFLDLHRLPELFCGFHRRAGQAPTLYPVACSPQSWASAAVFLILEACLGLRLRASPARMVFRRTVLPASLPQVEIKNLTVGNAKVDLSIQKEGDSIEIVVAGARTFGVKKAPGARDILARLRKYRGRLPADFTFDRLEPNERR